MTTHSFICKHCKIKFSMESQEPDVNEAVKDIPARCPKCMKVWGQKGAHIEHDFIPPSVKTSLEARRKINAELSAEAHLQAARYAAQLPKEQMVTVKDPDETRNQPLEVPQKLVEGITTRLEGAL